MERIFKLHRYRQIIIPIAEAARPGALLIACNGARLNTIISLNNHINQFFPTIKTKNV